MTDRRIRARFVPQLPALALLVFLAVASLLPGLDLFSAAPRGGPVSRPGEELQAVIDGLRAGSPVLVDLDPDLGTYPEIRYATRAALAELLRKGANLAVVSFSVEGRAIANAEIVRLRSLGAGADRLLDLGFVSGGEPALVQLANSGVPSTASGPVADAVRGRGLAAFRLALVIGGGEIGPRSWVEQVQPRVPGLPIAAITPTFLLPELQPYRGSGQLVALVGTFPATTAFGRLVASEGAGFAAGTFSERALNGSAVLFGMLVAIAVLVASSAGSLIGWSRSLWRRPGS